MKRSLEEAGFGLPFLFRPLPCWLRPAPDGGPECPRLTTTRATQQACLRSARDEPGRRDDGLRCCRTEEQALRVQDADIGQRA